MNDRIDRAGLANTALVISSICAGGLSMILVCFIIGILPDYSTFWVAARLSLTDQASSILYDAEKITEFQSWLVSNEQFRPWAYPPSSLLVLLPFAELPFWPSLVIWSGIGASLYFTAAWFFSRSMAVAGLASFSFSTVLVAVHGHFTNLVAALLLAGLAILGTMPITAGIFLGAAATIKPQLLVLAPLALLAGRHYSALIATVATGALIGIGSIVVFGTDLWLMWLRSLPHFLDIVHHNGIAGFGVTPASMAAQLGLQGYEELGLRSVLGLAGLVLCWRVWRITDSLPHRLVAMIGGGFLVLPYAMSYELAVLAPAAAIYVLAEKREPADWWLAVISALVLAAWGNASTWVAAAFTFAICSQSLTAPGTRRPSAQA